VATLQCKDAALWDVHPNEVLFSLLVVEPIVSFDAIPTESSGDTINDKYAYQPKTRVSKFEKYERYAYTQLASNTIDAYM